ncbi:MAG: 16S rRNA (cytosine(967)-C(5))-methyltransferase RsmB [Nitrospinota bacterium]
MALNLICEAERPGARVDDQLRAFERRAELESRDRAFVRELVYGTLRWRGHLDQALSRHLSGRADDLPPALRNILRLGAYQILFTDRVPVWAAVDEAVRQARRRGFDGLAGLVNGVLRTLAREPGFRAPGLRDAPVEDAQTLAGAESHPVWMVRRWVDRWGLEAAARVCRANNEPGPLTVRVNLRRCGPEILREALQGAGVEVTPGALCPEVLRLRGGPPVLELPGFREGWFVVQDEAAALMAHLMGVRPGEWVWDACAGPGGKSVHMAELMGDEGLVLATDTHAHRLSRVLENARRLGLRSVRPIHADATAGAVREEGFDAVLVDAPCSGLGVLRRHPEAKWNKTEEDIFRLRELELKLLREASRALRAGGRLLYCVCSNEDEETRQIVQSFEVSAEGARFQREDLSLDLPRRLSSAGRLVDPGGCFSVRPGDAGTDGFFAARWRRPAREGRRSE